MRTCRCRWGLLIDSSGSMYDKRPAVDKASLDFVKLSNPEDEEFLVDFSWEAFIDQDFTNNIDQAAAGFGIHQVERRNGDLRRAGGLGGLPGEEREASEAGAAGRHGWRRQCFECDAGADDTEDSGSGWAGDLLCWACCLVEDTDKRESRHARRVLETLAEQTGGAAYFPRSMKDVDEIAAEVAQGISGRSTRSRITRRSRRRCGGYRRCMWRRRRRALEGCRCGREAGTIRGSKAKTRRRAGRRR